MHSHKIYGICTRGRKMTFYTDAGGIGEQGGGGRVTVDIISHNTPVLLVSTFPFT